ncbi:16589_t:CDS:2, partial [Cetraspora pellucida]
EFNRIHILNTSNCRQNRNVENTTSVPPIEEVKHVLSIRFSVRRINQSLSIISRRSQRHSSYLASPYNNTNINNPDEAQNNNQSQDSSNYKVRKMGSKKKTTTIKTNDTNTIPKTNNTTSKTNDATIRVITPPPS